MKRALHSVALGLAMLIPAMPSNAQDANPDAGEIVDNTSSALSAVEEDMGEKPPFTVSSWKRMTKEGQQAYVRVTIEGLRWSPRYAACRALTPGAMLQAMQSDVIGGEDHGPLLMHVASAAQRLCS